MGARDSLKRSNPHIKPRKVISVHMEGETEEGYIKGLKSLSCVNSAVELQLAGEYGEPMQLVKAAIAELAKNDEIDEVWCISDVEAPQSHPKLNETVSLACANKINIVFTNPCFELWLLLHHRNHTGYITTDAIEKTAIPGVSGKHIEWDKFSPFISDAKKRAQNLRERHRGNGTKFSDDNPSSEMDLFLDAIDL